MYANFQGDASGGGVDKSRIPKTEVGGKEQLHVAIHEYFTDQFDLVARIADRLSETVDGYMHGVDRNNEDPVRARKSGNKSRAHKRQASRRCPVGVGKGCKSGSPVEACFAVAQVVAASLIQSSHVT